MNSERGDKTNCEYPRCRNAGAPCRPECLEGLASYICPYDGFGATHGRAVEVLQRFAPSADRERVDGWCPDCKGSGTVKGMTQGHGPDDYEIDVDCPKCGGTGAGVPSAPYWLIERGSPAEWWVRGAGKGDGTMAEEHWTRDASKAQRFNEWGAKQHAKELETWGVRGPLRATEHMDCDGPDLAIPSSVAPQLTPAMIAAFEKSWTEITMPARNGPQRITDAYRAMMAVAPASASADSISMSRDLVIAVRTYVQIKRDKQDAMGLDHGVTDLLLSRIDAAMAATEGATKNGR